MPHDANLTDPGLRARAVQAARGATPFDVLIENGTVIDMVTGEERAADIGLVGPLIASVHAPNAREAEKRIDATGRFVVPGLIDTHMHVESSMVTPAEYAAHVLPRGVTTALWDPHEFANVAGLDGMGYALACAAAAALRFLPLAPTCVPSAPGFEQSGGDFDRETVARLLARPDIHGAAEMMTMDPLLSGDPRVAGIVGAGLASGKRVCGHARGLSGNDLNAYAAAGVETDHELTSAADFLEKLRAGLTIELRGSHTHLLPEFAEAILALGHMPQTVTLCTDDVFPDDLLAKGGLDQVIRHLIALNLPAAWVYRAATLNAATRIGRPDLGLVAPGKRADLVILTDRDDVRAETVVLDGNIVARDGLLLAAQTAPRVPERLSHSVSLTRLGPDAFEVSSTAPTARVATLSKPRFPEWSERTLTTSGGTLDLPQDMIRMAIVNRYAADAPVRVALMENWGTWTGAFASTVSHDSHNLTVFGTDAQTMAAAATAVLESQGGMAVAHNGVVLQHMALPIAGLISPARLADVARDFRAVRDALDQCVTWEPPFLVFKALFGASLVCNAGPRLSDIGIVDPFENIILESCILDAQPG
ncbi:adenine deaminase [Tateyamaria pelophila]|uniref:adenine deaminase n=1 Tax=Tateyamaria pelophila TaxID=328415 RepID=UPI001CBFF713|nr:adenine deaminase C-terminal domain-containing protein [Tateyamaria pelophila]